MKILSHHYAYMKAAIQTIAADIPAMRLAIAAEGKAKDVNKRLRWDCSYRAIGAKWICDNIYPYANDDHIDTALRSIMQEIATQTGE